MLTVTTDPDLNRNELFRTPLRANYMYMKCLGLPRTELEADFLVSGPNSKTHRWPALMLRIENILGAVLGTTYALRQQGWKKRHGSGDSLSGCSRASITSGNRAVEGRPLPTVTMKNWLTLLQPSIAFRSLETRAC